MSRGGASSDLSLSCEKFCEVLKELVASNPQALGALPYGRRSVLAALQHSANDRPHGRFSITDLLELLWQPFYDLVGKTISAPFGKGPPLAPIHEGCLKVLLQEMQGTGIAGPSETMKLQEWIGHFQGILYEYTGAKVSQEVIEHVINPLVPSLLPPCLGVIYILLRTPMALVMCGKTLAREASRRALEVVSEMPLPSPPRTEFDQGIKDDLFEALGKLALPPLQRATPGPPETEGPLCKRSRTVDNRRRLLGAKTDEVRFALQNRVVFARVPKTLEEALRFINDLKQDRQDRREEDKTLEEFAIGRVALVKHMWLLDMAMDTYIAEDIFQRRTSGNFLGVCIATDESPPGGARFSGLRFQITNMYIGYVKDKESWEASADPPVGCRTILADICQCPGKTGEDLLKVLDKQLGRLGLSRADVISGTGDGGGENEGKGGFHANFERANPSYARRRCIPHISWRTSDMAISAAGEIMEDYKAIAAHLADGITWQRLRALAIKPIDEGGLALFRDGSPECHKIFHKGPPSIIAGRPLTDKEFLEFLRGKEEVLARLCLKDGQQRSLKEDTKRATEALGFADQNIYRNILCEILHRTSFLYFWNGAHPQVAAETSMDLLMERATKAILDLSIDQEVLTRLGTSYEDLERTGAAPPKTWVEVVVRLTMRDEALTAGRLPEALDFHRRVSDRASSHLGLLAENLARSHWQAAALLSKNPEKAQAAARTLLGHIARTSPSNRTPFERFLFEDSSKWECLVTFANARPAVRLWQGRGLFEDLFRWLANLFLVGPDHVLDCERIHARWQWLIAARRAVRLPTLNAVLRLTHYLDGHHGVFPPHEDLEALECIIHMYGGVVYTYM